METQDTIKNQTTIKQLVENLRNELTTINELIEKNQWTITVDGKEKSHLNFELKSLVSKLLGKKDSIKIDFDFDMSKSARKNIAKRLWKVQQKPSRRNINTLFLVLRKLGVIKENIKVNLSKKEQKIQAKRKVWVKLRNEAEKALQDYKAEKGNFYKKDLVI